MVFDVSNAVFNIAELPVPLTIDGCVLWLRSDLGAYQDAEKATPCVDNSLIWTLANQTGIPGRDLVQATEAKRPLYLINQINDIYPIWRFNGTDEILVGLIDTCLGNTSKTLFIVAKNTNLSLTGIPVIHGYADNASFMFFDITTVYYFGQWANYINGGTIDGNWHCRSGKKNVNTYTFWIDGTQINTGDLTAANITDTKFALGGSHTGTPDYNWAGDMAEVIYYDSPLSDSDRITIQNYLNARYGLWA